MKKNKILLVLAGLTISSLASCVKGGGGNSGSVDTNTSTKDDSNQKTYTVTFNTDGGEALEPVKVKNGEKVAEPAKPTKQGDAQYSYGFEGWYLGDSAYDFNKAVTEDITLLAHWSKTLNQYTVTWQNDDGTLLEKDEKVDYGTVPIYDGETPVKKETAQYSYAFKGWDKEVAAVTGDVTYTASFEATLKSYTVTWQNDDGTLLEKDEKVDYGTVPTYDGAEPTKAGDAQYSYKFKGWDKEVTAVTGDATYIATFTTTINKYKVTLNSTDVSLLFVDEAGKALEDQSGAVEYNGDVRFKLADKKLNYLLTHDVEVTLDGKKLTDVNGVYVVTNLVKDAEVSLTGTKHTFNGEGICEKCGLSYKDILFLKDHEKTLVRREGDTYTINATEDAGYMVIDESVVNYLADAGLKYLYFEVSNSHAPTAETWKQLQVKYGDGEYAVLAKATDIFDKKVMKVSLTKDTAIHFFTDRCTACDLIIKIKNVPSVPEYVVGGEDVNVTYQEGNGYRIAYGGSGDGYDITIPSILMRAKVEEGATSLAITFRPAFGGETQEGNPMNCRHNIIGKNISGEAPTDDWAISQGFISGNSVLSGVCTAEDVAIEAGVTGYRKTLNLTNTNYNWIDYDLRIYITVKDVFDKPAPVNFISSIVFA